MQRSMIIRMPLKLPHQTFGEAFSFENLTFDNVQTGYFMILAGNRAGEETGTAEITVDAVLPDGSYIEGIPFLKKHADLYRFEPVEKDEINIENCPVWREYMITDRMMAKYGTDRIRLNISAVQDSLTPCCVFVEATDLRYASEMPFDEENNSEGEDNTDEGDTQSGGDDPGTGDDTGSGDDIGGGDGANP